MEISTTVKERGTVIMAILALLFIGITVLASTLQTFEAQEASEQRHLNMASQSILLALESAIYSGSNDIRRDYLNRRTNVLFDTLKKSEDIIFVGIIDHRGGRLLTADSYEDSITLPRAILDGLLSAGKWSGKIVLNNNSVFVVGKEIFSPNNKYLLLHESPPIPLFLLVGLDTQKLDQIDVEMKESVLLQSAFIFLAALTCWILAFLYLRRRKKANRAEVLERFQTTLLDNLPDGLLLFNADFSIRAANPAATIILESHLPTLAGRSFAELPDTLRQAITQPHDDQVPQWQKVQLNGKHLELLTLAIQRSADYPYLAIIRDRTALYKLERNLAEAEKLASIGTLAAAIAHEVRNPLSSLRGFAQYFVKKLAGQQPEEEYAQTMVLEADRLNRVITDLLFLSSPKVLCPESVDLQQLAQEITSLLQFELKEKKVELATDFATPTVTADKDALKQCLLNLLLNSIDAMEREQGPRRITLTSCKKDDKTYVSVKDTGKGMSQEQLAQALEPFYTDKVRGTGLGLAIVNRTALDHGGYVDIKSNLGQGCAISLVFPASQEQNSTTANTCVEEE